MTREEILKVAKPILFNAEMVRAILKGLKTEIRIIMRPQPKHCKGGYWEFGAAGWSNKVKVVYPAPGHSLYNRMKYKPGDFLYVRETWAWFPCWDCGSNTDGSCDEKSVNRFYNGQEYGCYGHRASFKDDAYPTVDTWHPSIHMPKAAARIFLKVADVRLERLQNITIDGIRNEGLTSAAVHVGDMEIAKNEFALLWDSTVKIGDYEKAWNANPWVWVIRFERVKLDG